MEWPNFVAHYRGQCEYCRTENVDLCVIPDYMAVCQDCFENEMCQCDVCGRLLAPEFGFEELPDGRMVCEDCMDEMVDNISEMIDEDEEE